MNIGDSSETTRETPAQRGDDIVHVSSRNRCQPGSESSTKGCLLDILKVKVSTTLAWLSGNSTLLCLRLRRSRTSTTWPAPAVIRRPRALSGFIGRKARVGGFARLLLKPAA